MGGERVVVTTVLMLLPVSCQAKLVIAGSVNTIIVDIIRNLQYDHLQNIDLYESLFKELELDLLLVSTSREVVWLVAYLLHRTRG